MLTQVKLSKCKVKMYMCNTGKYKRIPVHAKQKHCNSISLMVSLMSSQLSLSVILRTKMEQRVNSVQRALHYSFRIFLCTFSPDRLRQFCNTIIKKQILHFYFIKFALISGAEKTCYYTLHLFSIMLSYRIFSVGYLYQMLYIVASYHCMPF